MYSAFHTGGSQHHVAGEVIGSSSLQPDQSSSWRSRYFISNNYNLDASHKSPVPPPSPKTPSPPSGRLCRIRSSTWDSSGVGKMSPFTRLSKSNSLDFHDCTGSIASVGSTKSLTAILQGKEGGNQCEATKFVFEDDGVDLFPSDSDSESKESEIIDMHETEQQAVLRSVHEVIQEHEHDLGPRSDVKREADETEGIFRGSSNLTMKSVNSHGKGVRFLEDVTEYDDEISSRPSYCAKLPALTQWDKDSEDEEGSVVVPPIASLTTGRTSEASRHFQQRNPQPSLSAKRTLIQYLNPFGDLSWSLIGRCIVRTAPCFWCTKKKLGISATDREILLRLNLLCAFFCVIQIIGGVLLFMVRFTGYVEKDKNEASEPDEDKPLVTIDLWSLELFVFCLSVINLVLLIASVLAQRAIRDVNLVNSVRFMWVLFWLLPIQIFCMIGLFDVHQVNETKIKHWWEDPSMKSMRSVFCEPEETANGKCNVPILGGIEFDTEEDWCREKYNDSIDCEQIRDDAQDRYNLTAGFIVTANAIWALLLVVLMWVTLCVLQAIITLPIVQRSKESNIPLWLTSPIVGCYLVGYVLLYTRTSIAEEYQDVYWIALVYLVSGGLFTLAAGLGLVLKFYTVLNGRQRRMKQGVVIVFICTIVLTIFTVTTIFVTSLIYSLSIVDLPEDDFRQIACVLDMSGSCTGCEETDLLLMCPEWTDDDVQSVLETIMKQSATLAAIFLVYSMITLRYGFVLFQYVSRYQIEYV
mmetsp:Transcript_2879/g.5258  ORF Transcript_2879/g.5258 Transcript_2879/m.5258 type:complete len:751 (-) Transcript_2879:1131-3383(-)